MLKMRAGGYVFFGLSARNLALLKQGRPIAIDMTQIGPEPVVKVVIFYGETEEKMRADIADMIGPETVFKSDIH